MITRCSAIIFDLDGTLLNSYKEYIKRLLIILYERFGIPSDVEATLIKNWHKHTPQLLEEHLGLSEAESWSVYRALEKMDESDPMPLMEGAADVLAMLNKFSFMVGMKSNRDMENLLKALEHYGLVDHFCHVSGGDLFKKPDPRTFDELLAFLKEEGIGKQEVLYVGDTTSDVQCAIEAGIEIVVVTSGVHTSEQLVTAGAKPYNVLVSIKELPLWLEKWGLL